MAIAPLLSSSTAKYSLRPLAREKLAKVAGIVSGHPVLKLEAEGTLTPLEVMTTISGFPSSAALPYAIT